MATMTDPDGAYIGLTDFLNEGTFAWVDGTAVGGLEKFHKSAWGGSNDLKISEFRRIKV